jgi:hypothetical protein
VTFACEDVAALAAGIRALAHAPPERREKKPAAFRGYVACIEPWSALAALVAGT